MPIDAQGNVLFPFYQRELTEMFGNPMDAKQYLVVMDFSEFADAFSHVRDYEGNKWGLKIYGNYGGAGWSVHSWGLALDLNAAWNAWGNPPTFSEAFVRCFTECGFEWGGLWTPDRYRDGMHFQLPWVRDRQGPLAPIPWSG